MTAIQRGSVRQDRLEEVAARYAVALTPVLQELIDAEAGCGPVSRQFLPDVRELDADASEFDDPIGDAGLGVRHVTVPDRLAQTLRDEQRILSRRRRQDDRKLLATVACHQVTGAFEHGLHDGRHLLQTLVASHVAAGVGVEREMIDVAEDQR